MADYTWYPLPASGKPPTAPSGFTTAATPTAYTYVKIGTKTLPVAPSSAPPSGGASYNETGKPVKSSTNNSAAAAAAAANAAAGAGYQPGAGTSSDVPGVTSTLAGDIVPFALPHQAPAFTPASGLTTAGADGTTSMTYSNWVEQLHQMAPHSKELIDLQNAMIDAGFYSSKTAVATGVADTRTIDAWKNLGIASIDSNISASTLLAAGQKAPSLINEMEAIQSKINLAQELATSASSSNVTLTDPNEVAQRLQAAFQSIGAGPPSKAETQKFVNAFINGPQGEVAAERNQVNAAKANDLAGANTLRSALTDIQQGNLSAGTAAANSNLIGPTSVAEKAQPNLDAEAIATAKASDPAQYYANSTSYAYGILQRMLSGDMSQPTSPSSPTSLAATGGILTTPMAGAL